MGKHLSSSASARSGKRRQAESEFDLKNMIAIGAGLVLLIAARLIPSEGMLRAGIFFVPFAVLAFGVVKNAYIRIQVSRFLEAELLVLLAAVAMFVLQEYTEAVFSLFLFRLCRAAEELVTEQIRKKAGVVFDLLPSYANVETNEGVKRMKPRAVPKGSIIDVAPGEMIPLDGMIIDGVSDIDASSVLGSARPKAAAPGSCVLSGCINVSSPIRISVTREYQSSVISKILAVADRSGDDGSNQEKLTYRYSVIYTCAVSAVALIMLIVGIFKKELLSVFLRRSAVLLLSACPAALAMAVPLTYYAGIALAFGGGVLVKSSWNLETIAKVRTFVTNKTGTLTEGDYRIIDVKPIGMEAQELLDLAATAEGASDHPIARAIREQGVRLDPGQAGKIGYEDIPGRGVHAVIGGKDVYVGNAELVADLAIEYKVSYRPGNIIYVIVDGEYSGYIEIADKPREGLFDALEGVRATGVDNFVMLTGDTRAIAKSVASCMNFEMVKADLRKGAKLSALEYLMASRQGGSTLCFIGDPFDDAEELRRADIGIGVGCFSENMDLTDCGAAMMGYNFSALATAFQAAKKTYSVSRLNILVTICLQAFVFVFGAIGALNLWPAIGLEALLYAFVLGNTYSMIARVSIPRKKDLI